MTGRPYLGQALKFPYEIDSQGKIAYQNDAALIKQSLKKLFSEPLGTEFFRETYGSEVRQCMFEPNDLILGSLLDYYIFNAIEKWERRIKVINIFYEHPAENPSLVNCKLIYQIKQSSEIDTFIFPFYRELKN